MNINRADLRGMDGGDRLRVALDSLAKLPEVQDAGLIVVDNGSKGPNILDTRDLTGEWVIQDILPCGVIAALTDLDDPTPATLLTNGFDVVLQLGIHGDVAPGTEVLFSVFFHERLGLEPPEPFYVCAGEAGWEKVDV